METEAPKPRTTPEEVATPLGGQFGSAMKEVAATLARGSRTHRANEWRGETPEFHMRHAVLHLLSEISSLAGEAQLCSKNANSEGEDDLAHAATRLLMALEVRSTPL